MRRKSVAVLDIRSSEITAVVGERGVNNTFIIKSKYSCAYDGYAEGELLDKDNFLSAVHDVVKSTVSAFGGVRSFFKGFHQSVYKSIFTLIKTEFTLQTITDRAHGVYNFTLVRQHKIKTAVSDRLIFVRIGRRGHTRKICAIGFRYPFGGLEADNFIGIDKFDKFTGHTDKKRSDPAESRYGAFHNV